MLAQTLNRVGLVNETQSDISDPLVTRLVASLHNGPCGALGLDLPELLRERDARWCLAQCVIEGVKVLRLSGMRPSQSAHLGAWLLGHSFGLPARGVDHVARRLLAMDLEAGVSVLQDLRRGQATQILGLNGEIVRRARRLGIAAPCNALVSQVVCAHERAVRDGQPVRWLMPWVLRRRMSMHQAHAAG